MILNPYVFAASGLDLATEILADNPWAYYKLDEAPASTSIADASPNARDLPSVVASPTFGSTGLSPTGTAVTLNGTTQYITSNNNQYGTAIATDFNGNQDFTFEALIKPSALTTTRNVIHIGNYSVSGSQGFWMAVMGNGSLQIGQFTGSFLNVNSAAGLISTGVQYHVCVTRAVGGAVLLFINGHQVQTGTMAGNIAAAASAATGGMRVTLGIQFGAAGGGNPGSFFAGVIDHAAIYNSVLSPARILVHARAAGYA